ncbi:MAG: hypothetical protein NTY77_05435 [Elusimicrobia bacterium]|nr:hypothetical protein [Elusimicrobiota bacterium]
MKTKEKKKTCCNCGGVGAVTVLVLCPECKGPADLAMHDARKDLLAACKMAEVDLTERGGKYAGKGGVLDTLRSAIAKAGGAS